jgi:hypothetical protein
VFKPDQLKASHYNPQDALIRKDPRMKAALGFWQREMKKAGFDYAHPDEIEPDLRNRNVDLLLRVRGDSVPGAINQVWFGNTVAVMLAYDRVLMDQLRGRSGVRFINFPVHVDAYLNQLPEVPVETLPETWRFFHSFYFSYNDDPERLARVRSAFAAAGLRDFTVPPLPGRYSP